MGMCGWLMINLPLRTWVLFAAWLAIGLVIYFTYGIRHSRLAQPAAEGQP
jgi:APA family basic amino acid/polyamine antiporter